LIDETEIEGGTSREEVLNSIENEDIVLVASKDEEEDEEEVVVAIVADDVGEDDGKKLALSDEFNFASLFVASTLASAVDATVSTSSEKVEVVVASSPII
jgi:hypothetical protein